MRGGIFLIEVESLRKPLSCCVLCEDYIWKLFLQLEGCIGYMHKGYNPRGVGGIFGSLATTSTGATAAMAEGEGRCLSSPRSK